MAAKPTMRQLLYNMRKAEASDLHLKVGMPPVYRIAGELRTPQGVGPLTAEDTDRLMSEIIAPALRARTSRISRITSRRRAAPRPPLRRRRVIRRRRSRSASAATSSARAARCTGPSAA